MDPVTSGQFFGYGSMAQRQKGIQKKKNKQIMFYASQQMQNIKKYMDSNLILITTKYS